MRWNTYIARKLLSGGYGMLYNWFCTQQQAAVEYGYLYNWYAATDARNIAASGWHVPTNVNFTTLQTYLGGSSIAGGKLKEVGTSHWDAGNLGTNESGFNARGAGNRSGGIFGFVKSSGTFWSTNSSGSNGGGGQLIASTTNFNIYASLSAKVTGLSIRLIKDSTTLTHGQTGTYVDPSGIIYPTICIGTQEWVACNIMTKHYRNGDAIPEVTDNTAWAALTTGARCSYNNTESNAGSTKKLSSSDEWVVGSWPNWNTMRIYLGGVSIAGGKLKETGLTYWNDPNTGATNEVGFNGRGSGLRTADGDFVSLKNTAYFGNTDIGNYVFFLSNNSSSFGDGSVLNNVGSSLRLLYTGSGTPTTYTGNDGTVYPVVLIGTQRWISMNLKETKWRDGTDIQNITDNTAWSLLQAAACCDIENDPTKR